MERDDRTLRRRGDNGAHAHRRADRRHHRLPRPRALRPLRAARTTGAVSTRPDWGGPERWIVRVYGIYTRRRQTRGGEPPRSAPAIGGFPPGPPLPGVRDPRTVRTD